MIWQLPRTIFSDTQIVNLAVQLIKNMCDFEKWLIGWYAKLSNEHTWLNFQSHFEHAHHTLRKVRGTSMKNTTFQQQANCVTECLLTEICHDNQSIRDKIKATEAKIFGVFENFLNCNVVVTMTLLLCKVQTA